MLTFLLCMLAQTGDYTVPVPVSSIAQMRTTSGDRLVLVTPQGAVLTLGQSEDPQTKSQGQDAFELVPRGGLVLPDASRTLLCLGRWNMSARPKEPTAFSTDAARQSADLLFALGPKGLFAYELQADGTFAVEGTRLARRANFDLRVGTPQFAPLMDDVNADGKSDCVVPGADQVSLWIQKLDPAGVRSFEKAGDVVVEVSEGADFSVEDLSDSVSMTFSIPGLNTKDINGDGRPDLIVKQGATHGFHLQRVDGSYAKEPDIKVDLGIFKDPEASGDSNRPGGALTLEDRAAMTRADLNGDGISDHVISHGRKLWVFPGGSNGPQFTEPSTILRSAEPITGVMVARIDDDDLKDLLLLRIDLPTIPTLMLGLFSSWDISLRASAYRNLGDSKFETRPFQSSELQLRLPPILDVMHDPYSLLERFRSAGSQFRDKAQGDFNGDGKPDLLLLTSKRDALEVYYGQQASDREYTLDDFEQTLRKELFEAKERVWDVDRLLGFIGGLAAEQERRFTEGQPANTDLALENPEGYQLVEIRALDLNGDGRDNALAVFAKEASSQELIFRLLL
jgi:hypothetical protein